ncbi:hypothetical protein SCA6_014234 [Theobroma cacao]
MLVVSTNSMKLRILRLHFNLGREREGDSWLTFQCKMRDDRRNEGATAGNCTIACQRRQQDQAGAWLNGFLSNDLTLSGCHN